MKVSNKYILNFSSFIIALCLVFGALTGAPAQTTDGNKLWTTVGSAGTVDETDTGKIFFDQSIVQMGRLVVPPVGKSATLPAQTQSAVIRYNITPVDGLFTLMPPACVPSPGRNCPALKLTLRYLASGAGARVVARLIEVDLASGAETTRMTFNSGNFSVVNRYKVESVLACGPSFFFNFRQKAYYIEAALTTNSLIGGTAAGIQMIKIDADKCFG